MHLSGLVEPYFPAFLQPPLQTKTIMSAQHACTQNIEDALSVIVNGGKRKEVFDGGVTEGVTQGVCHQQEYML